MSDPPGMIWLQWHDNPEPTWERDQIHDDDIEYVLAESYDGLRDRVKELQEIARRIVERKAGDCFQFVVDDARRALEGGGEDE